MAFGDYGNPYYYGNQQYQPQQNRQTANNQSCGGSFYWVNNEQEAREWSLPPNGAVMLMDRNKKAFYLKACDGFGMVLYFKRYPYHEEAEERSETTVTESNTDYVSRDEYTQEITKLREELEAIKSTKGNVIDDE